MNRSCVPPESPPTCVHTFSFNRACSITVLKLNRQVGLERGASDEKAEEDQAAILAAIAASGKTVEEVLALLKAEA